MSHPFQEAQDVLRTSHGEYRIYRLDYFEKAGIASVDRLPFSIKVLLEGLLRLAGEPGITPEDAIHLARWEPQAKERPSTPCVRP